MKSTKQEQEAMKQELPKRKKKSSYNYDKYEWGENMREEMNSNSRKWNLISLIKSKQKKLNRKRMKQKESIKSKRLNIQTLGIPIKESRKFEAKGWIKEIIKQLCKSEAHEFLFKGFSVVHRNKPTPRHHWEVSEH